MLTSASKTVVSTMSLRMTPMSVGGRQSADAENSAPYSMFGAEVIVKVRERCFSLEEMRSISQRMGDRMGRFCK
jgi:hypothetical protein